MPDYFALFDLSPSPALDGAALKAQFTKMTAAWHPDKFQNAPEQKKQNAEIRYSELNRAYQTLSDSKARLLLLYEMTTGAKPRDVQRIPPGTMDLFVEVGQVCQNVDAFIQRRQEVEGALARAALKSEELTLQETLIKLSGLLESFAGALEAELTAFDVKWRSLGISPAPAERLALAPALEAFYRKFSYLARWRQQVTEREITLLTMD